MDYTEYNFTSKKSTTRTHHHNNNRYHHNRAYTPNGTVRSLSMPNGTLRSISMPEGGVVGTTGAEIDNIGGAYVINSGGTVRSTRSSYYGGYHGDDVGGTLRSLRHGTVRSTTDGNLTLRSSRRLSDIFNTDNDFQQLRSSSQHLHPAEKRMVTNRADRAISNFHIEFENGDKFQPGNDITGKVTMDVWRPIDIRYLEFVIQGKGSVRQFKEKRDSKAFSRKPKTEIYLNKKILLLSPQNGQASIVLTPGKYVSSFLYKLPTDLPPSVEQAQLGDGHMFHITYSASAHICDYVPGTDGSKREAVAQVIKATRRSFTVLSEIDYQALPGALEPLSHAEQYKVGISPFTSDPTSVLIRLNQQVYSVGDVIGLHLEVFTPDTDRIGTITADFEQRVIIRGGDSLQKHKRTIVRALDDPRQRRYRVGNKRENSLDGKIKTLYKTGFKIPIHKTVPSLLPHSKLVTVNYCLNINIKFRNLGGKIYIRAPLTISPAMSPEQLVGMTPNGQQQQSNNNNIPVFNKPVTQFGSQHFTKNTLRESNHSLKSATTSIGSIESSWMKADGKKNKHERLQVKYKNCFGF